jgi:flagellar hook protein FlgE
MSLYGALLSGVSGLKAQTQSLATISDNVSNVNTDAYKRNITRFSTLVTGTTTSTEYTPGGVRSSPASLIEKQGLLQASSSATDVAISGGGFFVVKADPVGAGEQLYTRAGSFSEDNAGQLQNAAGYFLQGWALDQQGSIIDINKIQTVAVGTLNGVAADTTSIKVGANLDATQTPAATTAAGFNLAAADSLATTPALQHFSRQIRVFDKFGTPHNLALSFQKLSPGANNDWGFSVSAQTAAEVTGTLGVGGVLLGFGTLTFNGDGSLGAVNWTTPATAGTAGLPVTWSNGAQASNINIDFGTPGPIGTGKTDGLTQFASGFTVAFVQQDGTEVGLRTGISIDRDGFVVASFSNGSTQKLYKLPVATFANPSALEQRNGNAYAQTDSSGEFNLRFAKTGTAGQIESSALEGSNVDLAEEFTNMIITQRAYSASAKTITTADEMLDELLRIKR